MREFCNFGRGEPNSLTQFIICASRRQFRLLGLLIGLPANQLTYLLKDLPHFSVGSFRPSGTSGGWIRCSGMLKLKALVVTEYLYSRAPFMRKQVSPTSSSRFEALKGHANGWFASVSKHREKVARLSSQLCHSLSPYLPRGRPTSLCACVGPADWLNNKPVQAWKCL